MLVVKRTWAIIAYEEDDQPTHTAENGYKCADPDCICQDSEEGDAPYTLFLPSTEEALATLRAARGY